MSDGIEMGTIKQNLESHGGECRCVLLDKMIVDHMSKPENNMAHMFSVLKTGKQKLSVKGELMILYLMNQIQSMILEISKIDEMINERQEGLGPQVDAEPKE